MMSMHRRRRCSSQERRGQVQVEMQVQVRTFIAGINQQFGATVLLTSHYMQDIAALTPRLLIIDQGALRYDGALGDLARRIAPERRLQVRSVEPSLVPLGFVEEGGRMVASVPAADVNALVTRVLALVPLAELGVEETPLEEVMSRYFREKREQPA